MFNTEVTENAEKKVILCRVFAGRFGGFGGGRAEEFGDQDPRKHKCGSEKSARGEALVEKKIRSMNSEDRFQREEDRGVTG